MPYILNKSEKSRVYHKGDRYFVSQVQDKHLCRQQVDEDDAHALVEVSPERLDNIIADVLQVARNEGSESYYEVKM